MSGSSYRCDCVTGSGRHYGRCSVANTRSHCWYDFRAKHGSDYGCNYGSYSGSSNPQAHFQQLTRPRSSFLVPGSSFLVRAICGSSSPNLGVLAVVSLRDPSTRLTPSGRLGVVCVICGQLFRINNSAFWFLDSEFWILRTLSSSCLGVLVVKRPNLPAKSGPAGR